MSRRLASAAFLLILIVAPLAVGSELGDSGGCSASTGLVANGITPPVECSFPLTCNVGVECFYLVTLHVNGTGLVQGAMDATARSAQVVFVSGHELEERLTCGPSLFSCSRGTNALPGTGMSILASCCHPSAVVRCRGGGFSAFISISCSATLAAINPIN